MTERLRLELPVILPEVGDAADTCVSRLLADLRGRARHAADYIEGTIEG